MPSRRELRAETEAAQALGIFGAPSFVTADGELFWGNDRLEHALAWARDGAVIRLNGYLCPIHVMAGLGPAIHDFAADQEGRRMPGLRRA